MIENQHLRARLLRDIGQFRRVGNACNVSVGNGAVVSLSGAPAESARGAAPWAAPSILLDGEGRSAGPIRRAADSSRST